MPKPLTPHPPALPLFHVLNVYSSGWADSSLRLPLIVFLRDPNHLSLQIFLRPPSSSIRLQMQLEVGFVPMDTVLGISKRTVKRFSICLGLVNFFLVEPSSLVLYKEDWLDFLKEGTRAVNGCFWVAVDEDSSFLLRNLDVLASSRVDFCWLVIMSKVDGMSFLARMMNFLVRARTHREF